MPPRKSKSTNRTNSSVKSAPARAGNGADSQAMKKKQPREKKKKANPQNADTVTEEKNSSPVQDADNHTNSASSVTNKRPKSVDAPYVLNAMKKSKIQKKAEEKPGPEESKNAESEQSPKSMKPDLDERYSLTRDDLASIPHADKKYMSNISFEKADINGCTLREPEGPTDFCASDDEKGAPVIKRACRIPTECLEEQIFDALTHYPLRWASGVQSDVDPELASGIRSAFGWLDGSVNELCTEVYDSWECRGTNDLGGPGLNYYSEISDQPSKKSDFNFKLKAQTQCCHVLLLQDGRILCGRLKIKDGKLHFTTPLATTDDGRCYGEPKPTDMNFIFRLDALKKHNNFKFLHRRTLEKLIAHPKFQSAFEFQGHEISIKGNKAAARVRLPRETMGPWGGELLDKNLKESASVEELPLPFSGRIMGRSQGSQDGHKKISLYDFLNVGSANCCVPPVDTKTKGSIYEAARQSTQDFGRTLVMAGVPGSGNPLKKLLLAETKAVVEECSATDKLVPGIFVLTYDNLRFLPRNLTRARLLKMTVGELCDKIGEENGLNPWYIRLHIDPAAGENDQQSLLENSMKFKDILKDQKKGP